MNGLTLRRARNGLLAHKRRLAGTFAAVFLGVAFLSGTLMLGDTLQRNFERLFADVTSGTDAVVRSATSVDAVADDRALIPAATLAAVREVDGVAAAAASIQGTGTLLDADGERIGGNGPPTLAGNWIDDPDLNPYRIAQGRPPRADDEVVVNRGAAEAGGLRLGQLATLLTPEPVRVRIVGIATFGDADGLGATTFTAFTTAGAERHVTGRPGEISSVVVAAQPGVSQQQLVERLRPVLAPGLEALTGTQLTDDRVRDVDETFLTALRTLLVAFAAVALVVAAISIRNTFAIVAAQRMREAALLRAVGATRGQVLGQTLLETLAIGLAASLAGLLGGAAVATLLKGLFDALGFALPAGGLAVTLGASLLAVAVGVLVTLLAGLSPAVAAAHVAPIAALREAALDGGAGGLGGRRGRGRGRDENPGTRRKGSYGPPDPGTRSFLRRAWRSEGRGRPFSRLVAAAATLVAAPIARLRGPVGRLAQRNAARAPRRTAGAASALLVGVAVVTAFTVVGASLKATLDANAAQGVRSDLVVSGGSFGEATLPPALAQEAARLPRVRAAVGLGSGSVRIDGADEQVRIADPAALASVLDVGDEAGAGGAAGRTPRGAATGTRGASARRGAATGTAGASAPQGAATTADDALAALGADEFAVSRDAADERDWRVGSAVALTYPDGARETLRVGAVYGETGIVGDLLLARATWAGHATQDADSDVFVTLAPGVAPEAGLAAVEQVAARWGGPDVRTRAQFVEAAGEGVDMILGIVYALLALAVLIALLGIANALSLATHERTRELGLLRAVGLTRAQLRATVRWEAVVVAVLGTLGGLLLGVPLAWALVQLGGDAGIERFALPVAQLAAVLVVGGIAGVLAGLRPARRAARMDVLRAIAAE